MNIKTYPIQFTEARLSEIRIAAEKSNTSIKQYILEAINEKLKKDVE